MLTGKKRESFPKDKSIIYDNTTTIFCISIFFLFIFSVTNNFPLFSLKQKMFSYGEILKQKHSDVG